jgi:hypothetical protein
MFLTGKYEQTTWDIWAWMDAASPNFVMYVIQTNSTLKNVMHLPSDVCPQPLTRAVTPAKSGGFGLRQGSFTGLMKSETFTQIS